jgi:F-type H+-transporting ATPase subunit a
LVKLIVYTTIKKMFFSPLEQFENHLYIPVKFFFFEFDLSSFFLSLIFSLIFFLLLFGVSSSRGYLVPTSSQFVAETFYLSIISIIRSQTGKAGMVYFPYVFTLFTFIFCCNFLGLVPFSFTPTAQIFLPFFLALASNLALLIVGLWRNGFEFVRLFIPSGISPALLPLIFTIELSTYLLRTFSLALRLFANMMAGHTLLFICSMTLYIGFTLSNIFVFFAGYLLVMAVFALEVLISFLQAYVFSVLFCVYMNDALHPSHLLQIFLMHGV